MRAPQQKSRGLSSKIQVVYLFKINMLYIYGMLVEQNFRDEKSECIGFSLRASYSRSTGRMLVLSLLATPSTIVMLLLGYHAENKGLHLRCQASSIK
ncbi:hypothetical protein [Enterobacter bugandensis]|uniref:hypothetical protein n=1 Tax=Enterobacter bugandensis TaxID=881260 RepID=UPI000AB4782C|nr:hypothetical protein [Enterobacter bugandensis]